MEALSMLWKDEEGIDPSLSDPSYNTYSTKEIHIDNFYEKSKIRHDIAKELGLESNLFPTYTPKVTDEGELPRVNGLIRANEESLSKMRDQIAFLPNNNNNNMKTQKGPLKSKDSMTQCDIHKLSHQRSKIITLFPLQYETTNIKLDGLFSDGGRIRLRTSTTADHSILLNFTLYAQTEDLLTHVLFSEIDTSPTKSIHISNHHSLSSSCLVYYLDIIFPSNLDYYKNMNIKVNHVNRIEGDLKDISFQKFSVGVGRGSIQFKDLKADNILLGTLNGVILGNYLPTESIGAASIKGATHIQISPQSNNLKSTSVCLDGPVKTIVTKGKDSMTDSAFTVHCWLCEPTVVSNNTATHHKHDVHITSSRRKTIKIGYYKELCGAHFNIHSRYGESKLYYS
ncbi:uncharacterized protein BX663DRAFT_527003 [Cokeromyces recurvatus]|uniref:uncharacterized protein n=1 Tax=Cokeromyces recurvatus TaxID=90255 RepID=UPI00221E918F|nr:uncharacterized protein BX663DRAFT_527003 [Cokeromyces recurvatus]KAI7897825.1 hypothetical protein BX663DRAFT_527003 [Cokeromyces recurvatus]